MEPQTQERTRHNDVYAFVTDKIIEQLNQGTVPWRQPWTRAGIPRNLLSNRPYRGINVMLLAYMGYDQNYFVTYKQLQGIGGRVKQGEKGHMVVYWNFVEKQIENSDQEVIPKKKPMLRYYSVYNVAQCTGLEAHVPPFVQNMDAPIASCEGIFKSMPHPPVLQHKEQTAWYNPITDIVNMPKQRSFTSIESYYSTLWHELVHSTGHISRLRL
jgi:antirestriction protein ArdC